MPHRRLLTALALGGLLAALAPVAEAGGGVRRSVNRGPARTLDVVRSQVQGPYSHVPGPTAAHTVPAPASTPAGQPAPPPISQRPVSQRPVVGPVRPVRGTRASSRGDNRVAPSTSRFGRVRVQPDVPRAGSFGRVRGARPALPTPLPAAGRTWAGRYRQPFHGARHRRHHRHLRAHLPTYVVQNGYSTVRGEQAEIAHQHAAPAAPYGPAADPLAPQDPFATPSVAYQRGVEAFFAGRIEAAHRAFSEATVADPEDAEAWMAYLHTSILMGHLGSAAEAIERVATLGGFPAGYHADPRSIHKDPARFDRQMEAFAYRLRRLPRDREALIVMLWYQVSIGEHADARKLLHRLKWINHRHPLLRLFEEAMRK